ncbi:hypothetical protein HYE68_009642 [Fusarium pseudograminearum]|nr:hypothetical protein HYE68_009642 [Fusarium pseudograminearum]
MATTNSHRSPLSDLVQELDPNAPPPAPLDLLSTVSSLFSQRQEKLLKEKLARQDALTEAQYVAAREAAYKRRAAEKEAEAEFLDRLGRAIVISPRIKDTKPSKEEIEALVDEEVAKEERGLGLRRAIHETKEAYEKRMVALEYRIDSLDIIEKERKQKEPVHYVDGFPANVINVDRHVRPISVASTDGFSCLQCMVLGRRCGRTSDDEHICEPCARNARRCLVKRHLMLKSNMLRSWKFAEGQFFGYDELEDEARKWMLRMKEKLRQKKRPEVIQPMPAWPEKKDLGGKPDQQNMPRRWQDFLKSISPEGE